MQDQRPPIFLERSSYRRRRLIDAARILPVLGLFLWLVPLLWPQGADGFPASRALLYLFGVWLALVLLAALVGLILGRRARDSGGARP